MTDTDPALTFRDAGPDDADWIAGLLTYEGYPAGGSDIVRRLERYAELDAPVRVAEMAGERLGFIASTVVPRFEVEDTFPRDRHGRRPDVRDRGIGRALMDEAERCGGGRRRLPRGDRRPSPAGGPPPLRARRLRRLAHFVPEETALSEVASPASASAAAGGLLALPWETPLASWRRDDWPIRELPVGPSRHLVRFVVVDGITYALKEEPLDVARREYDVLLHMESLALPAVRAIGIAEQARARAAPSS